MTEQSPRDHDVEAVKADLREAWDDLIGELQSARDAIDNPALFPPTSTSRVLAEGYRYLAGFVHHGIERAFHEDPDFPAFRNALSIYNKSTIENCDAIYFYAAAQESAAKRSKEAFQMAGVYQEPIVTEIAPAQKFYRAEEYHQRYLEKGGFCH